MVQYRSETLAQVRRRIGYITQREKFVYGTLTAVPTSTTMRLNEVALLQTDALIGYSLYVVAGTGIGQALVIQANSGTLVTVSTAPGVALDTTSTVEIWSSMYGVTQVNAAINEAILDAQDQALVKASGIATISTDRRTLTPPATFTKVYAVSWLDSGSLPWQAHAVNFPQELQWLDKSQWGFCALGGVLMLNQPLMSGINDSGVIIYGYRLPNLLALDSDPAEVRSDYLAYKAAAILETPNIANPQFDPEGMNQRVNAWLREVARAFPSLKNGMEPNTVDL